MPSLLINTNFEGLELSDIKTTIIKQTTSEIEAFFEYPNGFKMHTFLNADGFVDVKCNWSLKEEANGSFTPIPPTE